MPVLIEAPPHSEVEPVTELMHGIPVTDPYRWLEDQESPRTRAWISGQKEYANSYLHSIRGREQIQQRIRALLDVRTYDSLQKVGDFYFFRKRVPGQEQPCICLREGCNGPDEVLIDPIDRGTGPYTAIKLICVSTDATLLLYEVKEGGERSGCFELFDVARRQRLPDALPHGYLRGFAFSPDSKAFYYVHEPAGSNKATCRSAYKHVLGTNREDDIQVFCAGGEEDVRLQIISGHEALGFLLNRFAEKTLTDFYLWPFHDLVEPKAIIRNAAYIFAPRIISAGRVLALTDLDAPNYRIVEVGYDSEPAHFKEIVAASDCNIQDWTTVGDHLVVSYLKDLRTEVNVFDFSGKLLSRVPLNESDTVRLLDGRDSDELCFERESYTQPIQICAYSVKRREVTLWDGRTLPFDSSRIHHVRVWFKGTDGTDIPMSLVGSREALEGQSRPTIMTSYGGYGIPVTPQFSVFVAFLLERGCLFALPHIRGGSEFGTSWYHSAKGRRRQVAIDDFLAAAQWLIDNGRTEPEKLAIFGGSNSGLLVGAALTQRPEMFRAVVCMVPLLDMVRYHRFDHARIWKDEYGTADDLEDFRALLAYSPYHNVRAEVRYPAAMFVSGDADQSCNPLHARKMTARLQAANSSDRPVILDYSPHRGHSPVLPLNERVEALTNRMAFLCDQLGLNV